MVERQDWIILFPHEKLDAWQQAKALAKKIYEITAGFPRQEMFGLVNQLRRAGVSVMSNLAEGCGRTSPKDQAHFSQIAFSSLMEVESQLQLACELKFVSKADYEAFRNTIDTLSRKISALRNSQIKRSSSKKS